MKTIIKISIILYTLLMIAETLDLTLLPGLIPFNYCISYGFAAVGVFCSILVCLRIEYMNYRPLILISVFLIAGRTVGFSADFLFRIISGNALYQLPFGSIDFFLFYMLAPAFLKRLGKTDRMVNAPSFSPVIFIPAIVVALPVFAHILPFGFSYLSIYSVVFSLCAAAAGGAAVYYIRSQSERKLPGYCLLAGIIVDLTIYLDPLLDNFILPDLHLMLFPYVLLIMTAFILTLKVEELDD